MLFAAAVESVTKANSHVDEGHEVASATIDLSDGVADQETTKSTIRAMSEAAVKIAAFLQTAATPEALAALDTVASMWAG